MNNLDNKVFHCINQFKVWKKGSNIDNICKQIIKNNDFKEISKDYLLVRLATLSNEQKTKIKLFNNSISYSVNEELTDLQTVKRMQYSSLRSSSVPIADTPVCSMIDDSIQDIPPVSVVTPACNNNSSSIQDIHSPLSDTVSPQQTHVTLKSLNKPYSDLYSKLIAIKEFLLNKICILRKKGYIDKWNGTEHLISSLQDKNKIIELTIKVSLLEEENLKLQNQIIENHLNHWQNAEYLKYRGG